MSMKDELRKELIKKRKSLTKNFVSKNSKKIKKLLFNLDEFKQAKTILFYVSYDNEVSTHEMIKEVLSSDKQVAVPVVDKKEESLILSLLENWNVLKPGAYGILEPKKENIKPVSPDEVDIIVVPGIGFDIHGQRLGHGMAYYDKLLERSTNTIHIGLAFECQIVDIIPTEPHDIPVDIIVTENRVIHCY